MNKRRKKCLDILKNIKRIFVVFQPESVDYLNAFLGLVVFSVTFYYTIQMPLDYGAHLELARKFDFSNILASIKINSYPLWHLVCELFERLLHMPGQYASAFSSSIFVYLTYYVSRKIMISFVDNDFGRKCSSIFAAMLMFVQPIYIPWFNQLQQTGQGSPNIINNPTNLTAKPFAIICVWLFVNICAKYQYSDKKINSNLFEYVQLAIFCFISVLAKPSFAQVCIPTVGIYLVYLLIKTKGESFIFSCKIALSWVPATAWMGLTFYLNFISSSTSNGNGIALSFFDVWETFTPCIPLSILLTTMFPICVLFVSLRKPNDFNQFGLQLGALMVFVGILEYGFIMETGDRMLHGNFSWGYNIGLGVFWTFATSILVNHISNVNKKCVSQDKRGVFLYVLFLLHFIFGIYYYFSSI